MATNCERCEGLTVDHWVLDEAGQAWVELRRCVNCGNVSDTVIEKNRGVLVGAMEGQRARKGKYGETGLKKRRVKG